jgi:hypothetical protein
MRSARRRVSRYPVCGPLEAVHAPGGASGCRNGRAPRHALRTGLS